MEEKVEIQQAENGKPANYEISLKDHRAYLIVNFVLGVLEVLLIFRFFFKLLGANPQNIFARFVYWVTDIFMFPFSGLFHNAAVTGQKVFEPAILIAMIVYVLIALGAGKFLLIVKSKPKKED